MNDMDLFDLRWAQLLDRGRWSRWLHVARILAPEQAASWSDTSECAGCIHLDRDAAWCNLAALPAAYNPVLTPRHGLIGMACCGTGKTTGDGQSG